MKHSDHEVNNPLLECRHDSDDYSQARQQTAEHLDGMRSEMNTLEVPHWDKGKVLGQAKSNATREFSFLPWLSMSFSIVAICMVVLNVNIQSSEQGITIAFGDNNKAISPVEVEAIVEERLKQYQSDNELKLAQFVMQMQEQQNQSNLKLATYLLDSARTERQQDISDVFLHFNDQLAEQQSRQNIQLQQLEQAVKFQKASLINTRL